MAERSPEQIRTSIEETRRELAFSVNDLRSKVTEITNWRRQLAENREAVLVGATIGAVIVGLVTVVVDFPTTTIIWTIWAIVYQQVENSVIQPQIQKRAIQVHPFLVLVSVLFGSTLLGIVGALVAIPVAGSIQILVREWWDYRHSTGDFAPTPPAPPPVGDEPAPA